MISNTINKLRPKVKKESIQSKEGIGSKTYLKNNAVHFCQPIVHAPLAGPVP
jgi:hypothetical protein